MTAPDATPIVGLCTAICVVPVAIVLGYVAILRMFERITGGGL